MFISRYYRGVYRCTNTKRFYPSSIMKVRAKLDIDLYNTVKNMKIMTLSFIFRKAKKKKKKNWAKFPHPGA